MQTPFNITKHELIGLKVKVLFDNIEVKGEVIDETKETIKIKTNKGEKIIIKKNSKIQFTLPNKEVVEVEGKLLIGRAEHRIKKQISKKRV